MKYCLLGRTGLNVSQLGLGAGGKSCLGQKTGKTQAESVRVVQKALDLGVNLFDTSERSKTEGIVGKAIKSVRRDSIILSTKKSVSLNGEYITRQQLINAVDSSLRNFYTDYIDIFHFHGVRPGEYQYVVEELLPELLNIRQSGKIRFLGITEAFGSDTRHQMLKTAVRDDFWDVIMVGFNLVNQSARKILFPTVLMKNVGVLGMFAVRKAMTDSQLFSTALQELKQRGVLPDNLSTSETIDVILSESQTHPSITDIAYRYCRDETAIHSVLVGTGNPQHLQSNLESFAAPPLAQEKRQFIDRTFGQIDSFSAN